MGFDISLLEKSGLDISEGLSYTGDADKYAKAIQRYFSNYESNRSKVCDFYEKRDYENYMVTVHSLKSNSRMIGAADLAALFEKLEHAARNNDIATINATHDHTVKTYDDLIRNLSHIIDSAPAETSDEISADEAQKVARELLLALDDFDDELSATLVKKLSGYPFTSDLQDMLKKAAAYIDDFMYDDAAELIKELSKAIV